jgi:hypothetical protein
MGNGLTSPPFLTLAPDRSEWSTSRSDGFIPGEGAHITHWTGGWVGLRVGLKAVEQRNISCACRIWNPCHPAHNPSLYRLSYMLQRFQIMSLDSHILRHKGAKRAQTGIIQWRAWTNTSSLPWHWHIRSLAEAKVIYRNYEPQTPRGKTLENKRQDGKKKTTKDGMGQCALQEVTKSDEVRYAAMNQSSSNDVAGISRQSASSSVCCWELQFL